MLGAPVTSIRCTGGGRSDARAEGNAASSSGTGHRLHGTCKPGDVPWKDTAWTRARVLRQVPEIARLQAYFERGVKKVIVAAPVKGGGALNLVMGVNDQLYEPAKHHLLTNASCTTNCLAPVVKVIHEGIGIVRGVITTIHDITNTQTLVDRSGTRTAARARRGLSLDPDHDGLGHGDRLIYPELLGKLNGTRCACRCSARSLTDCVFR